jgi:hypothetical protein
MISNDKMLASRNLVEPVFKLLRICCLPKGKIAENSEVILKRDAALDVLDDCRVHIIGGL